MNTARLLLGYWNPWEIKLAEPDSLSTGPANTTSDHNSSSTDDFR